MKRVVLLLAGILFVNMLMAQSPQLLNYQAVARDASGAVISGQPIVIKISIRQGAPTGPSVFSETHNPTTNTFGLVTLSIGSINAIDFSTIDWALGPYFVELELNGTVLSTTQLLSVPYALYSEKSGDAFSGDYADLNNQPTIPTKVSDLTNDIGFIATGSEIDGDTTNELQALTISNDTVFLSNGGFVKLPFDGDFNSLNNKPTIPTNVSDLTNDVGFIASGSEVDGDITNELQTLSLSNDTIFLSDGGSVKLPASSNFSGDYNDLSNKPAIPVNVSELTNDAGYIGLVGDLLKLGDNDPFELTKTEKNGGNGTDFVISGQQGGGGGTGGDLILNGGIGGSGGDVRIGVTNTDQVFVSSELILEGGLQILNTDLLKLGDDDLFELTKTQKNSGNGTDFVISGQQGGGGGTGGDLILNGGNGGSGGDVRIGVANTDQVFVSSELILEGGLQILNTDLLKLGDDDLFELTKTQKNSGNGTDFVISGQQGGGGGTGGDLILNGGNGGSGGDVRIGVANTDQVFVSSELILEGGLQIVNTDLLKLGDDDLFELTKVQKNTGNGTDFVISGQQGGGGGTGGDLVLNGGSGGSGGDVRIGVANTDQVFVSSELILEGGLQIVNTDLLKLGDDDLFELTKVQKNTGNGTDFVISGQQGGGGGTGGDLVLNGGSGGSGGDVRIGVANTDQVFVSSELILEGGLQIVNTDLLKLGDDDLFELTKTQKNTGNGTDFVISGQQGGGGGTGGDLVLNGGSGGSGGKVNIGALNTDEVTVQSSLFINQDLTLSSETRSISGGTLNAFSSYVRISNTGTISSISGASHGTGAILILESTAGTVTVNAVDGNPVMSLGDVITIVYNGSTWKQIN